MRPPATTIVLTVLLLLTASLAQAEEVMLSAAISTKDVVELQLRLVR
jgi:hypothetical protein